MLKLRHLRIRVETTGPACGADIPFGDGLNILRADNSSGKSTCMQAIIYSLGLEGMLSAKRDVPLPHAMTDVIEVDGRDLRVVNSWVALEMENARGQVVTVRRSVKSDTKDRALIEEFDGPCLSRDREMIRSSDYFVRRPGAAQREQGFHFHLAEFIGWDIPRVSRMDGSEVPLYLECLFPYFFVEQKHGWSGIQARIPTHFMIRDVSKRAAEFVLALDEYQAVLQRQRLEAAAGVMEAEWRRSIDRMTGVAKADSVVLRGLPPRPVESWQAVDPEAVIATSNGWVGVDSELTRQRERFTYLVQAPVATAGEDSAALEARVNELQEMLAVVNNITSLAFEELQDSTSRRDGIELRVGALEEDLQRHKDAALLRRLGSRHAAVISGDSFCPTCQQPLPDGFDITMAPMTPDESIDYIEQELRTFRAMRTDMLRIIDVAQLKLSGLREEGAVIRREIRAVKQSLISADSTPSIASVTERVRLEDSISALEKVQEELFGTVEELKARSALWRANRANLKQLTQRERTPRDAAKVNALEASLRQQLHEYHFTSLAPESIEIAADTYRPTHEGFDLGFDLSASDMIRVIWAYLLAFLETSMHYEANHARLLVFDEPRQQETNRMSFAALLKRAATDGSGGAQIIFATSEEHDALTAMLDGFPHNLNSMPAGQKILRRLA
ncbi:hypothetical protein [Kitasatospora purpeofusca]|uniref:ATP-binding protein n=1 Tax=Kitasatospora purpeofusca TaxID=67352 RepID=UPI00386EA785|nr:hypothetical protein OIP63_25565 [Kitasatospora purpeofusca]